MNTMHIIKSTTETVTYSFGTFERETWEIHGYELVKIIDTSYPEEPAEWRVHTPKNAPTLDNMNLMAREGVDYGVNWSAKGTRSINEARTYAIMLLQATEAAEAFTRIRNKNSA